MYGLYSVKDGYFLERSLHSVKRARGTRELYTEPHTIAIIFYSKELTFCRELHKIGAAVNKAEVQKALNVLKGEVK